MAIRVERSADDEIRFRRVARFMNDNPQLIKAGKNAPMRQMLDLLDIVQPVTNRGTFEETLSAVKSYEYKVRKHQNYINRLLAYRGLYMSVSFRHDKFFFKSKPDTSKKVETFQSDALAKIRRANQLAYGIVNYRSAFTERFTEEEITRALTNKIL